LRSTIQVRLKCPPPSPWIDNFCHLKASNPTPRGNFRRRICSFRFPKSGHSPDRTSGWKSRLECSSFCPTPVERNAAGFFESDCKKTSARLIQPGRNKKPSLVFTLTIRQRRPADSSYRPRFNPKPIPAANPLSMLK